MPEPSIIVRLLLSRPTHRGSEFFCVPTERGLDLPSLALATGPDRSSTADGLAALASSTHGRGRLEHRCVGYIRNVVPTPDPSYPHPSPWAHVPVFVPAKAVEPTRDGVWRTLDAARAELSARHWWPIVEHDLTPAAT
ncbi:hypothetical protein GCM10022237_49870 [Nocardioides ginsengisoli]